MRAAKKRLLILAIVIGLSLTLFISALNRTSAQSVVAVIPMTLSAQGVAVDATRNRIFVIQTNSSGNPGFEVIAINGVTNSILATIPVSGLLGQYGIAVNEVTGRVYVANGFGLVVIDADTFSVLSTISLPSRTTSVAVNSVTNRIYANASFTQLKVIDGVTEAVLSTIFLSSIIWDLEVDPVRNRIYATHESAGFFSVIDGVSNSLTTVPISGSILAMAVDPGLGQLYFADNTLPPTPGRLFVVDSTTHATLATLTIDTRAEGVGVDTSTHRVYLGTGTLPFRVTIIDGLMRSLVTTVETPVQVGRTVGVNRLTHRAYLPSGAPEPSSRVVVLTDPPPIIIPPSCVPPPAGMVSWWSGDGNAIDIANGNHGTLQNGATFAPGRVAQAFALDGVDDYVQFGDILDGLNGGFTLDAWIQTTSTVGNKAIIAKNWSLGGSWAIRTNEFDPRKVDLTVCSPDCATLAADAVQLISTSNINDGAWHFIAATFDGTTQRLYVDGTLEASGTNTTPAWTDNHHFCIGGFCDPSGNSYLTFGGLIDEVEIYNRALSASEIQAIYNAGSAGKCKNQAPVALCQNITVAAGASCTATAAINNGSYDPDGDALAITQSPAGPYPLGNTLVTLAVTDDDGASATCTATVTVVDNTSPTITPPPAVTINADAGSCSASGVTLGTPIVGDNCSVASLTNNAPSAFPLGSTTVTWTVTDGSNNSRTATQLVTVVNPNPVVTITGPPSGSIFAVGVSVDFTGTFSDAGGGTHSATWMFDSVTTPGTVNESTGQISATYSFVTPGVYKVKLTVDDSCGGSGVATTVGGFDALVVIYDPNGGFVTGGGWINSPADAYPANPSLIGKANFGFVSKYQQGATVPTGQTEFQFKIAGLNFQSVSYDWLVVAGARAQYKGSGTINGGGNYGFILTAIDGQISGGGGVDKFRIKIWDKGTGDIVYDNQIGTDDGDMPNTALGGGSIVIHK